MRLFQKTCFYYDKSIGFSVFWFISIFSVRVNCFPSLFYFDYNTFCVHVCFYVLPNTLVLYSGVSLTFCWIIFVGLRSSNVLDRLIKSVQSSATKPKAERQKLSNRFCFDCTAGRENTEKTGPYIKLKEYFFKWYAKPR